MAMKQATLWTSAIAMAVAAFTGTAYAEEPLQRDGDYSQPRRQFDDNIVTSRQHFDRPGREIEDGTFAASRRLHRSDREINDETLQTAKDMSGLGHTREQKARKIRRKVIEE
jgi:hypothetical protein